MLDVKSSFWAGKKSFVSKLREADIILKIILIV